jgi:hypothetical protein
MAAPSNSSATALVMHHPGFSTLSTASSDLSISWSCSCRVLCVIPFHLHQCSAVHNS